LDCFELLVELTLAGSKTPPRSTIGEGFVSIPLRAIPYVRFARRLFSTRGSLQSVAYQQDLLCAEETEVIDPTVYLPGQIERVTGVPVETTMEREIDVATSTTVVRPPIIAYHIKDAALVGGSIYVGRYRHLIADKSLFLSGMSQSYDLKSAALASSYIGTKYFGHWLRDDCTHYLLAKEYAAPLCLRRPAFAHQKRYEEYFGQDWSPVDLARIGHLVVFQDFSQNSSKRTRYKILRDRIKTLFPSKGRPTYIYLRRGRTGASRLVHREDELIDALIKRGFIVLDVSSGGLDHIIENLVDAKIVISMEGSHISHCVYSIPEESGLLVLQPPDRFSTSSHRDWAGCLNVKFGFVVGLPGPEGYIFPVSEVLNTVDLMLKTESRSRL
jgi:hypothetical protein